MSGKCGQIFRIEPRIAGSTCQAIQQTAAGLLVPNVEVDGIAAGAPVGTARSVDVDVTVPAATDCPQVWTIGARLSPVFGQVAATGNLNLQSTANGAWFPVPGAQVVLPEAGVYEVMYAAAGEVNLGGPSGQGAYVYARMFNVTSGTPVPISDALAAGVSQSDAAVNAVFGTATKRSFVTVAGPTTIRLEGSRITANGTPTSFTGIFASGTDISFKKVAD